MNGFWLFMLICSLLTPLTMLLIGSSVNVTAIAGLIILTLQTLVMCITVIPVENALKKKFGK